MEPLPTTQPRSSAPLLRGPAFDGTLIFGGFCVAILSLAAIIHEPSWFYPILVMDLWLLGYHHVIATFTRLCFDKASYRQRRWMIVHLLPLIGAATIALAWLAGIWIVVTVYFYWQWWHYARQSWGISRAYRRADPNAIYEDGWLDQAIFWAVPVYGILLRSSEGHALFIGQELWSIPVPEAVASAAGYLTAILFALWAVRRVHAAFQGCLATAHTLYMLTHFSIFALGYIWIPDITLGWLLINMWHNFQYIAFVWNYNNKRFARGTDPRARLLSYISQNGRVWHYLLTCVAFTGALYWGALRTIDWVFFAGLSATVVLYQIVNFHHYVVDALIWRARGRSAGGALSPAS